MLFIIGVMAVAIVAVCVYIIEKTQIHLQPLNRFLSVGGFFVSANGSHRKYEDIECKVNPFYNYNSSNLTGIVVFINLLEFTVLSLCLTWLMTYN